MLYSVTGRTEKPRFRGSRAVLDPIVLFIKNREEALYGVVKAENGMTELYHRRANIVIFSKTATKPHMGNAAFFSLGVFIPCQLLDRNCQKLPKTCTGVSANEPVNTLGGIPLPAVALSLGWGSAKRQKKSVLKQAWHRLFPSLCGGRGYA